MNAPLADGQWLDFYALLDVPVSADEDTLRKRIGKVYSEAAANSDHRDLARRHYFQALVERVLPQCRRVLLDPEWRAKYDRQHILHSIGDPSAQNYVAFIGSMRGKFPVNAEEDNLPQKLLEDIKVAREVVECAIQGAELDLLPSKSVSRREIAGEIAPEKPSEPTPEPVESQKTAPVVSAVSETPDSAPKTEENAPVIPVSAAPLVPPSLDPAMREDTASKDATREDTANSEGATAAEVARAQVLTAQEANEIRRRRASNPDTGSFASPVMGDGSLSTRRRKGHSAPVSRVVVGEVARGRTRLISPTSMNLMVAIVGVLLTISIQRFATQPAVATSVGRTPIYLAVSSEMEGAMLQAESEWEKTPEGSNYDLVVQSVDSRAGLRRALGAGGPMPDAWIPSDSLWAERYNALAPQWKRAAIDTDQSIAQTPMVLVARFDRAGELRRRFPGHVIPSWSALRSAVAVGAPGHLGLTDPQRAATGALSRFSMAREWGVSRGLNAGQAAQNPQFWKWMAGFEDNAPAAPAQTGAMIKDLVQSTSGRFWWGIGYESDALGWMNQGKSLEIYYLPRTNFADHPFCPIERVGAPSGMAQGRASFEKFLRTPAQQKLLLSSGFRPTEVSLKTKFAANPFLNSRFKTRGARAENLPRDERPNTSALEIVVREWGKRFG